MDDTGLRALLIVSIVSAAAPFACALLSRFRVPQVVVLIALTVACFAAAYALFMRQEVRA